MSETIDRLVQKYPEYADVPRDKLIVAFGDKYPEYLNNPKDPEFSAEYNRLKPPPSMRPMGLDDGGGMPTVQPEKPPSRIDALVAVRGQERGPDLVSPVGISEDRVAEAEQFQTFKQSISAMPPKLQRPLYEAGAEEAGVTPLGSPEGVGFSLRPESVAKVFPFLEGAPADIIAGTVTAAGNVVKGLNSEEGLFLLGLAGPAGPQRKGVLAFFGTEIAFHAPEQARKYVDALKRGDRYEAVTAWGELVASAFIAKHAFQGSGMLPKKLPSHAEMLAKLLDDASSKYAKLPVEDRALLNNPRMAEVQAVAPLTAQAMFNTGEVTRAASKWTEQGQQIDVEGGRITEPAGRRKMTDAEMEAEVIDAQKDYNTAVAFGDEARMADAMDRVKAARLQLEGVGSKVGLEDLPGEWPPTADQLGTFRSKGATAFREETQRAEPERLPVAEQPPEQTRTAEPMRPATTPHEQTDWGFKPKEKTTEVSDAVRERSTEEVPVLEASETGEGMGKEVRSAEEPAKAQGQEAVTEGNLFTPESLETKSPQAVGILPSSVMGMSPGMIRRGWRWIKKLSSTTGGKIQDIFKEAEVKHGAESKAAYQIEVRVRGLLEALRKRYGISRLSMLGGGSRAIPVQAVRTIDAALRGDPVATSRLPAEIYGKVIEMRDLMDKYSSEIIEELVRQAGQLPPDKRQSLLNLIDTIQGNMGVYVHRSYRFFQVKDNAPDWYDQLNPQVRTDAENYLINNSPTPLTVEQAQALAMRFLDDLKNDKNFGLGSKEGAKDNSIFMKRNVIAPEIRALLGEQKNPIVNFALSTAKMASWVANQRFLNRLRSKGLGRWLFEEGTEPPGFSTKIAGDASDAYSPLNGLRTSPEIAESLKNQKSLVESMPDMVQPIVRLYFMLNAQSKFAATGQSWMTQVRNLTSRSPMAIMAGHWNAFKYIPKAFKMTLADLQSKNPSPAAQAYIERIRELGLDEGSYHAELKQAINDINLQSDIVPDLHQFSLLRAGKRLGWEIPGKFYRASDLMGNIMGWEAEKALLRMKEPGMAERDIEVQAAENIKQMYPYYGRTVEAVKLTRYIPFSGPFATFSYHVPRTMRNVLKQAITEMRSDNPNHRKVGRMRMSGYVTATLAPYIIQEMSKMTMGISNEEEEDFRKFRPFWDKNAAFMFYGKNEKTGQLKVLNLSYLFPTTYVTDPILAMISAIRSDKSPEDAATDVVGEFLMPYLNEQMLASAVMDTLRNKTKLGGEIYQETDPGWEKTLNSLLHIEKAIEPGTTKRVRQRIIPAFRDKQPDYGRILNPGEQIFRELTGMATETFDFANGLHQATIGKSKLVSDARRHFTTPIYKNNKVSESYLLERYMEADSRRFRIWKEQRALYRAAVNRGVPKKRAIQIIKDLGFGNDAALIANGIYKPIELTADMLSTAKENGHTIPKEAIREYQLEMRDRKLD